MKTKLIKRKIKFAKKGTALGLEIVAPVVLGDSWNKMSDKQKAQYSKQYAHDWKNIDKIYENKIMEKNNKVFENPEYTAPDPMDRISDHWKQSHDSYANVGTAFMGITPATVQKEGKYGYASDYGAYRPEYKELTDEVDKLQMVLDERPDLKLANMNSDNALGSNQALYNSKVKSTRNNKYYESLIAKANAKYGTNFKTRADIAAFQDKFGASKVDGIIGPETEALLDFYFPQTTINSINTRKMYANESNDKVRDRTLNTLAYGQETEPEKYNQLFPVFNSSSVAAAPYSFYYSEQYESPMTKYQRSRGL